MSDQNGYAVLKAVTSSDEWPAEQRAEMMKLFVKPVRFTSELASLLCP